MKNSLTVLPMVKLLVAAVMSLGVCSVSAISQHSDKEKSISLSWVMQQTLLHHPSFKLLPYELRIADAKQLQASTSPSPDVSIELENMLGSGEVSGLSAAVATVQFSQLIELGGKRQRRIELAQTDQKQITQRYEQQRVELLSQAAAQYYVLLRLQALKQLQNDRISVEQAALTEIQKRAQAGAVSQVDVAKLQLRLATSKAEAIQLDAIWRVASQKLASYWSAQANFSIVAGYLKPPSLLPSLADVQNALLQSPEYLKALNQERFYAAQARLERAKSQSDIRASAGLRHDRAIDETSFTFNVTIPLFSEQQNRGNRQAAEALQEQAWLEQRLIQDKLRLLVLENYQALEARREQANQIQQLLLPLAEDLLKQTYNAYQTGQSSVLQLVDAQAELFALKRDLIESHFDQRMKWLELERLTGHSLSSQIPKAFSSSVLDSDS